MYRNYDGSPPPSWYERDYGIHCASCGEQCGEEHANKYEELICADCHKSLTDNRKRQLKEESDDD